MAKKRRTKEEVLADALNYSSRFEWQKNSSLYFVAKRNGWLEKACAHMRVPKKWTKEEVLEIARGFKTRMEWKKSNPPSYDAATRKGWLREATSHMATLSKNWTKEEVIEIAKQFKTRGEWRKGHNATYQYALKRGWQAECSSHMRRILKKWDKESTILEAKKFSSISEWAQKSGSSYYAALRNGWIDEIKSFFVKLTGYSKAEAELLSFINKFYPKAHSAWFNVKDVDFAPAKRFQLDIYVPELRKGIEFNGKYWHSFEGLKKGRPKWTDEQIENYHELKRRFFSEKQIDVLEVWEKDWKADKDKEISKVLIFLGLSEIEPF